MSAVSDLTTTRDNYATALATDSVSPQPSYSLDGQSVSRQEWRDGLLKMIVELNKTINAMGPYVVTTKQVL